MVLDSFNQEQQKRIIHHFLLCKKRDCMGLSSEEKAKIKTTKKRQMFNHSLIFDKNLPYESKTQLSWLVYVEGEGQYTALSEKNLIRKTPKTRRTFFLHSQVQD